MAYNDSGELPVSQSTYSLGGYTFELKVQTVHEPGEEEVVSVFAICRSPDGTRETVPMDFPAGTTVEGWYVEANESTADVYIIKAGGYVDTSPVRQPIPYSNDYCEGKQGNIIYYGKVISGSAKIALRHTPSETYKASPVIASKDQGTRVRGGYIDSKGVDHENTGSGWEMTNQYTLYGRTVYYRIAGTSVGDINTTPPMMNDGEAIGSFNAAKVAWVLMYGEEFEPGEMLVARFAIDIREAGGGPGGDWDEPGDVGPDPEKHFTLTVSVTGASSGSNSRTPLEPGQAGGYGDGGTGGNGGGGGAGASTVIIYEFATSKADNVVQEATAQGPSTGGPGGKGGKGGDGCILIFY